jgi:hypothetical protein
MTFALMTSYFCAMMKKRMKMMKTAMMMIGHASLSLVIYSAYATVVNPFSDTVNHGHDV